MIGRLKGLGLGLIIGVLGGLAGVTSLGSSLEEQLGLDWLFRLRGPIAAPPEVAVVAIDQPSADELRLPAKPSDWPRSVHADLIDALVKANASVIAFDLSFSSPSREPQHDSRLAESMRAARNVVVVQSLKPARRPVGSTDDQAADDLVPLIPLVADSVRAHAPFVLPKVSRLNEYAAFKIGIRDEFETATMPMVVLQIYGLASYDEFLALLRDLEPGQAATLPPDRATVVESGDIQALMQDLRHMFSDDPGLAPRMRDALEGERYRHIEPDKKRMVEALLNLYAGERKYYVNFYGRPRAVRTIPYWQVLQPPAASAPLDLSGVAVFVGYSALTLAEQDQVRDDYHTVFSLPNGVYVSGVEVAATAFANLLHDRPIKPLPWWANLSSLLLWGLVFGIAWRSLPNPGAVVFTAIVVGLYVGFAVYKFEEKGTWLELAIPIGLQLPLAVFAGVYGKYGDSKRERLRLKEGAGRYLPPRVIDEILQNVRPAAQHQILFGVCLATDADQYTSLAEKMGQKALTDLLNEYYAVLFGPVQRHGGIVSDVVGDSMFAVWAAANPDLALRKQACEACLDITNALATFNKAQDRPLYTRLGLHCGEVLLGSIGADQHFEYRAVGDTVNTASRIQGLNKYLDTRLILSAPTAEGLEGEYMMRPLGSFLLAGKSAPVELLELMGRAAQANEGQRWLCHAFSGALAAYNAQQWGEACGGFQRVLERFPDDGPSKFYHTLCGDYTTTPPVEPWQPVVRMAGK